MSSLRGLVLGCVSDRSLEQAQARTPKRPVKELLSLAGVCSSVRCYHCHAKFAMPLDVVRHQFMVHPTREICLLAPVTEEGKLKHRASHYGKSPSQIYSFPHSYNRQLSVPSGCNTFSTVVDTRYWSHQTGSSDTPTINTSITLSDYPSHDVWQAYYMAHQPPTPPGLIESPPGLPTPDPPSHPSHVRRSYSDSAATSHLIERQPYATLPRVKRKASKLPSVNLMNSPYLRHRPKTDCSLGDEYCSTKRHTISSADDISLCTGFSSRSSQRGSAQETFYTLPATYQELMDQTEPLPFTIPKIVVSPAAECLDSTASDHSILSDQSTWKWPSLSTQLYEDEKASLVTQSDGSVQPVCHSIAAERTQQWDKRRRVKFGVPLSEALKDDILPTSLVDLIVYIAQEGVTTTDLFRRPGNPTDLKVIMKKLTEGKEVLFTNYNFYTLASVVKKFLLKIPGGVFGVDTECQLLEVLHLDNRMQQYDKIHSILSALPNGTQQLLALLFGTWFRIVNHSEYNTMSSEAVAKSVAGSLFHTCADDPKMVEKAVRVLQILIDDYGTANMFGRKNLKYFAEVTRTGINVKEKYRYEFQYPDDADPVSLEKYFPLYQCYLEREAKKRGFHTRMNAITEEEFYGSGRPRTDTRASQESSNIEIRLPPSSPPSPQSLQPHSHDEDYNPHKKLTHVSSLSAPEVNQVGVPGCSSPTQENLSSTKRMYLSTSLSRFDNVRRRQILRMKKRSNWFLCPNTSVSMGDSESLIGSREASIGKSSIDATSSDALASDVTASDGGLSDTPGSEAFRLSSDMNSTFDESAGLTPVRGSQTMTSGHTPLQRLSHMRQDVLNANHGITTSTPIKQSSEKSSSEQSRAEQTPSSTSSPSPQVSVTEKDVRYFMVENFYGNPQNGDS